MKRGLLTASLFLLALSSGIAKAADNGKPTALIIGGEGGYATLTDEEMATVFHGYFADYNRVNVPFPGDGNDFAGSIDAGAKAMYDAIYATDGRKTIAGASEGAPAVYAALRQLEKDPNRPSPEDLNAIVYAAPGPLFYTFGPLYQPAPITEYDLTIIKAEYDGIADAPDNWLNLLAVANAYMGAKQLHVSAAFTSDLSTVPEQDITVDQNSKGGTTTTYVVPTPVLPLLQPLIDKGMPASEVAALDGLLRPIIDSAYVRTWTGHAIVQASPAAPSQQAAATAAPPSTTSASAASSTTESRSAVRDSAEPVSATPAAKVTVSSGLASPRSQPSSQGKPRHRATGSSDSKAKASSPTGAKGAARADG